jgi:hypothetical protein
MELVCFISMFAANLTRIGALSYTSIEVCPESYATAHRERKRHDDRLIHLAQALQGLRLLLCSSRWFAFAFGGGS